MHGDEKTDRIDTISDSTKGEGQSDPDPIDNRAREETDTGEDTVQGEVLAGKIDRLVQMSADSHLSDRGTVNHTI